ncbi:MAG: MarR family transcriptional regulator [Candidatus Sumerlaeia bacterium]|nr:MarR family transcriptional regulator [Candidatus Sumerlaeia bacterium]
MTEKLLQALRQSKPFTSLEQEVHVNILVTAEALQRPFAEFLRAHDLSPTQYNILRILRGAGRRGLSCTEVGQRLITRVPDITRLLDRLEARDLICRERDTEDRRVIHVHITEEGLRVLGPLDEPIHELHRRQLEHMGPARLRQLSRLLDLAREGGN